MEMQSSRARCGNRPFSRKVLGKSARDNPERYCGWFWVLCSSKKFERMARGAMDVCLRMLKESNNRRFNSYSVRNSVLIISHITFRDGRVHIFSDKLSRNSCILKFILRSLASGNKRKEMYISLLSFKMICVVSFPKPHSQVLILVYRNWSVRTVWRQRTALQERCLYWRGTESYKFIEPKNGDLAISGLFSQKENSFLCDSE